MYDIDEVLAAAQVRADKNGRSTYVAICDDGVLRHEEPFDYQGEAREWIHWGHGCLVIHDLREIKPTETRETSHADH